MLSKIVRKYANRRLFQYYTKHRGNSWIKTLKNSKRVGILWNPSDEGSIEVYDHLRKILQSRGITSSGIAIIDTRRQMETLSTMTHSEFLDKRNIRWDGELKTGSGEQFIQEKFDILIDLTILKTIAAQYILVHSHAVFKVGWQDSAPNYYDLNIDVSGKPQCLHLMEQIVYYLENINEQS